MLLPSPHSLVLQEALLEFDSIVYCDTSVRLIDAELADFFHLINEKRIAELVMVGGMRRDVIKMGIPQGETASAKIRT